MPKQLIKDRRPTADLWKVVRPGPSDSPHAYPLPVGPLLVPVAVWRARKAELIRRNLEHGEPLGVWLAANEGPETIAQDLDDFTVIAIDFAKFTDGRGYSSARLLRERYGYRNELRAIGDVGRDQIFFLHRVGFDAFSIAADVDQLAGVLDAFDAFPETYQAAANQPLPLYRRRAG